MTETTEHVLQVADLGRGSETVLMVEDDPFVRDLTVKILRACGHATIEAANGEEAIKAFTKNRDRIDLVILDAVTPEKNRKEVYEEIRKVRSNARVVFMGGQSGDNDPFCGPQGDTVGFVRKPALLKTIRELLDRQTSASPE